ncbi:27-O-demethylrifamycin SV methyltransferase [Amycolatopsis samaneae]
MHWLFDILMGDNRHIGYWDGSENDGISPRDRFTDHLIGEIGAGPGQHVLDVGCGVGGPAVRLAKTTGATVTGITVSSEEVRLGTSLAERESASHLVTFEQVDAMNLPYPDNSFSAAWAIESLLYMPDRIRCLREIHRVLKSDGRFALTDYTERLPLGTEQQKIFTETFMVNPLIRVEEYDDLLAEAGFDRVTRRDLTAQLQLSCQESDRDLPAKLRQIEETTDKVFSGYYREYALRASSLEHDYLGYVMMVAHKN